MSAAPLIVKAKGFSLEVTQGPLKGQRFHFSKPLVQIGRGAENDLVLEKDSKVSRHHVEIRQINGQIYIHNVSEKNTLIINGKKVDHSVLEGNCRILIGETELVYSGEGSLKELKPPSNVRPLRPIAPSFSAPTPTPTPSQPRPPPQPTSRSRFYFMVLLGLGIFLWLVMGGKSKKKELELRTNEDIIQDLQRSEQATEDIKKQISEKGGQSIQYFTAQQHYIRGFRDYRQGQYGRAIQSFQAALAFYPQHELARRYLTLSKRRFDELVKFSMNQGRRYLAKNNFRLCASSFEKVLVMVKDEKDASFKEAKQYYEECQLKMQGKY